MSEASDYPTPPSTVGSEELRRRAKRQRRQNNSNEESATTNLSSTLSEQGFTAEKWRVGAPPLQLLPLKTLGVDESSPEYRFFQTLVPGIEEALKSLDIDTDFEGVELVYRVLPEEVTSRPNALTVLIDAPWTEDSPQAWLLAVDGIRQLLIDSELLKDVPVEIISRQAQERRLFEIIEESHPLVSAWPSIRPVVHQILQSSHKVSQGWQSIDVIRIGSFRNRDSLPIVVSITVDWDLDPIDWRFAQQEISILLSERGFPFVEVDFERGDVRTIAEFPLQSPQNNGTDEGDEHDVISKDYSDLVEIGSDLGPAKYFSRSLSGTPMNGPVGTFGGYLAVQMENNAPRKFGLTNYHVIREVMEGFSYIDSKDAQSAVKPAAPVNSELDKIDRKGMGPSWPTRAKMLLESPSRRKHNFTLAHHVKRIQRIEKTIQKIKNTLRNQSSYESKKYSFDDVEDQTKRLEEARITSEEELNTERERYDERKRFFDEERHILGTPWMCSGLAYRTPDNHRLDYCLIDLKPDRIGSNVVPPRTAWRQPFLPPTTAICDHVIQGIASCKTIGEELIYKVGARTGATTGQFNHIKSDVRMPWDKALGLPYSSEYVFLGSSDAVSSSSPSKFSSPGDYGSTVFTSLGKWIGLLFGGATKANTEGQLFTYVTDATAILDHMTEKITKPIKVGVPRD